MHCEQFCEIFLFENHLNDIISHINMTEFEEESMSDGSGLEDDSDLEVIMVYIEMPHVVIFKKFNNIFFILKLVARGFCSW